MTSGGPWVGWQRGSLPLIGKILNHSQPTTTAIDARLDLATMREALEDNSNRMLRMLGALPPPCDQGSCSVLALISHLIKWWTRLYDRNITAAP